MKFFGSTLAAQEWAQEQANLTNLNYVVFCRNSRYQPEAVVIIDSPDGTYPAPLLYPCHWATVKPEGKTS